MVVVVHQGPQTAVGGEGTLAGEEELPHAIVGDVVERELGRAEDPRGVEDDPIPHQSPGFVGWDVLAALGQRGDGAVQPYDH